MGRRRKQPVEAKQFTPPTEEELYSLFDVCEELDEACKDLMLQKKTKSKDMSERIKSFAEDHGCQPKQVRAAFKRYLEAKKEVARGDLDASDPLYTLMAIAEKVASNDYKPSKSFSEHLKDTEVGED